MLNLELDADEDEEDDDDEEDEDADDEDDDDEFELIFTAILKLNGITFMLEFVVLFVTLLKLLLACNECNKLLFVELLNMFK